MRKRGRRWAIALRKTLRRIVYSRSSAPSIAAGVALGIFIGLTPTVGFQMIVAAFLATILRMNRLAAVVPVWITNPLTIAPIYLFNFKVGTWVLSAEEGADAASKFVFLAGRISQVSLGDLFGSLGAVFAAMGALGLDVLVPLVLGSCIVGAVGAAAAYPVALWAVGYVRRRRESRSVRRAQARLARLEAEGFYTRTDTGGYVPIGAESDAAEEPRGGEPGPQVIRAERETGSDESARQGDEVGGPNRRAGS